MSEELQGPEDAAIQDAVRESGSLIENAGLKKFLPYLSMEIMIL